MSTIAVVYRNGWKTYMGAYNNIPSSKIDTMYVKYVGTTRYSDYAIVYNQYSSKNGHVVTYHEWSSDFTEPRIEKGKMSNDY